MNTMKVEIIVPNWVNWIAVDPDGEVWGYMYAPKKNGVDGRRDSSISGLSKRLYQGEQPKNWKEELYQWI